MSWWGKLLGGTVGFAIGGPIGALLGAALGHGLDRQRARAARERPAPADATELRQTLFFTATFAVMGHLAKADGTVTREEIRMAERVMGRLRLDEAQRRFAQSLFRQGKSPGFPLDAVLAQLRGATRSRDLLRVFLEIQVFAALADGRVHRSERVILERICSHLGFDPPELAQVERLVGAELGHAAHAATPHAGLTADHALLGVDPNADDAAVKRAYRRLMSQHHPDRLVAKGLPEQMMRLATAKTQEIKAAYERIMRARGR